MLRHAISIVIFSLALNGYALSQALIIDNGASGTDQGSASMNCLAFGTNPNSSANAPSIPAFGSNCFNPSPPSPPDNPIAAPGASPSNVLVGQTVTVSMVPNTQGESANNYKLYESRNNISYTLVSSVPSSSTMTVARQLTSAGSAYYRYKACNNNICSAYSPTRAIQVNAGAPPPPPINPIVLTPPTAPANKPGSVGGTNFAQLHGAMLDQQLVSPSVPNSNDNGVTPGQAGVSGGAGVYEVPIQVVPGRAGMQPNVSLGYSSRAGNGNAGVGWSVSAGGAISRCGSTFAQDGATKGVTFSPSADKLCLNGQRLIAVSGNYGNVNTIYSLEQNPRVRVYQRHGSINHSATYFEVLNPNGHTSFFGRTHNAKVVPVGKPYTLTWLLASEEDVSGNNRIAYNYTEFGDAERLLTHIYYTGNASTQGDRAVIIEYENKATVSSSYVYGGRLQSTQRVKAIQTRYKTSTVRRYNLTYAPSAGSGRDLLGSVQECVYLAGQTCKRALTFTWSQGATNTHFEPLNFGGVMAYPGNRNMFDILPRGDIDGNGVRDWSGVFVNAEGELKGTTSVTVKPCYENYLMRAPVCTDGDFNVDGLTDDWRVNSQQRLEIKYTEVPGAWINTGIILGLNGVNTAFPDSHIKHVGDYNNDGWPDLMVYHFNNYSPQLKLYTHTRNTNAPYNSNGTLIYTYPTNTQSVGNQFNSAMTRDIQFMGDMDGDGTLDLLITDIGNSQNAIPYPQPRPMSLLLNKNGNGHTYTTVNISSLLAAGAGISYFSYFLDINGDGLSDWLGWQDTNDESSRLIARLNQGGGTFSPMKRLYGDDLAFSVRFGQTSDTEPFAGEDLYTPVYGNVLLNADIDGDGKDELLEPGTAIVEGCAVVLTGIGPRQKCGRGLYGVYRANSNIPNSIARINYADKDDSMYQWNAFSFIEDSAGNFEVVKRATEFYGRVAESQFVDAFGTGLPSLISVHKKSFSSHSFSNNGSNTVMAPHFGNYGVYISRNKGVSNTGVASDYQPHDMLVGVSAPGGINANWHYRPLTTGQYKKGSIPFYDMDADYTGQFARGNGDYFHFASSMYAVAEFNQDNGVGSQNTLAYRYTAAVYNNKGRGFAGFRSISVEDKTRDITTTTTFDQKFPFVGKVAMVEQYSGTNNDPFSRKDITWERNTAVINSRIYQVLPTTTIATQFDFAASGPTDPLSTSTTTIALSDVDHFGNVKVTKNVFEDVFSTVTTTHTTLFEPSTLWTDKWRYQHTRKNIQHGTGLHPIDGISTQDERVQYAEQWDSVHRKVEKLRVSGGASTASNSTCASTPQFDCTVTTILYNSYGLPTSTQIKGAVTRGTSDIRQTQTRKTTISYSNDGSVAASDGYFPLTVTAHVSSGNTHVTRLTTQARTGDVLRSLDPNNIPTDKVLDGLGRVISIQQQGMPAQYMRYLLPDNHQPNNAQTMLGVFQAGTSPVYTYFDVLGRELMTRYRGFSGEHIKTRNIFDAAGNTTHQAGPYASTPTYLRYTGFDALGRPQSKFSPTTLANDSLETEYQYSGHTTYIHTFASDGANLTMSRTYDGQNKLISTVDAQGGHTSYAYNASGHPVSIKDAANNVISAYFDDMGRKTRVDDPNQGTTHFWYNAFGELEKQYDANLATQRFDMDALGRVTHRYSSSGTATFTWDSRKKGLLSQTTKGGATHQYYYDPLARLTLTDTILDGTSYKTYTFYDANYGRPKAMKYPNGVTVGYYYNAYGYLQFEYNPASGYVYREVTAQDAQGNVKYDKSANAKTSGTYLYSHATGQMLSSLVKRGINTVHYLDYVNYDSYGNITQQVNRVGSMSATDTFSYDSLQRLRSSTISTPGHTENIQYRFDSVGNLKSKSDYSSTAANAYSYQTGTNKLLTVALKSGGFLRLGYDAMGNQTHRNNARHTYYNEFNKPTRIIRTGADLRFTYDAAWQRYKQVATVGGIVTTTYYIGKHYEVEKTGSTTTNRSFISDTAILTHTNGSASIRFTHKDRLGSTTTFTNQHGVATGYRSYDPFGKPKMGNGRNMFFYGHLAKFKNNINDSENVTTRGFTGHEHLDDVELIHMNGRIYDYNIGRFLSVDPLIQAPGNSQSINPYSYIMNNPLAGVDPTGYCSTGTRIKDGDAGGCNITFGTPEMNSDDKTTGLTINTETGQVTAQVINGSGDKYTVTYKTGVNNSAATIGDQASISTNENQRDGTYFFGGAGIDGEYINDMTSAFEEAGISDVHAVNRGEWSGSTYADALVGVLALNEEVDVSDKLATMREKFQGQGDGKGQLNLVGYSYGSLVAAHVAMTRTLKGGTVDNLVLIGSPIASSFLKTLRNNPGIKNVIVRDLAKQGDPIRAGMSGFNVFTSAPKLFYQQVTGTGHFHYAGSGAAGQARRRELAKDLYNSGLR